MTDAGALLVVFVHGFKGSAESTFEQFPDRLAHLLLQTHPHAAIVSRVYPTYETRGSLEAAVDSLIAWLTTEVTAYEQKHGRTCVLLCGHSMGGLVSMDAALQLQRSTAQGKEMWPRVIGVLAYDSPYLGVNPHVFKNQFSTYHGYANTALKLGAVLSPIGGGLAAQFASRFTQGSNEAPATPSRLSKAAWIGVGTAAAAAIGMAATSAVINKTNPVDESYRWMMEHLAFVRNLWEVDAMSQRLEDCRTHRIPFHCFYTRLRPRPGSLGPQQTGPLDPTLRTFILLPDGRHPHAAHFSPLDFPVRAPLTQHTVDEITAHTSMFQARVNTSYFSMGLDSAQLASEWFDQHTQGTRTNPISIDLD
ncbi:hypothetical protein MBRA1_001568 [Malassezia brasiliensis]|uniref:DUF676 domain-containing protein n=1 Tax=Malassezia brasiliensis TaxID=1821822 RepID=A0AAF0DVT1_9BASI|nr:hypothetical protein MBRA1_001568 [Malassezia brasiliensis]